MCNISSYYNFEYNMHKKYIILKVYIGKLFETTSLNWKEICTLPKNFLADAYLRMFSASYFSCFKKKTITTISFLQVYTCNGTKQLWNKL